ncbi:MAG: sigma-70 family RNA polymerase sigma factor [Kofleriaceae bacterium]|nr:sigma-70 family RNA polymerase sigma factor [Kofleriaceae bacterium]
MVKRRIEQLLRELAPQVLGAVIRRYRDFSASEDAVQEAMLAAATQWQRDGLPDNPRAWLIRVAAMRMIDHVRSEVARRRREEIVVSLIPPEMQLAAPPDGDAEGRNADDTLTLLFMCCHPSLTPASAIALTLRAVGGLTTAEIAKAFLVPEATMAQRISRAKQTIKDSGIPFEKPSGDERAERLPQVLHVLYLIFNEGYTSSGGPQLARVELSEEAIRLTRAVHGLLPDNGDVAGLLALMLLTDARRPARTGPSGELIPLDEQDRSLWNRHAITEGVALVEATLQSGAIGVYQLQAAIAAVHDEAETADATDWPQILALYDVLESLGDNPVVSLNRAIAAAMVHGPAVGLSLLAKLEGDARIAGSHRLAAVRGHFHEKAGDLAAAIACFRAAAARTTSTPERDYLLTRAARLADTLVR